MLTNDQIEDFNKKQKAGYYTQEAIKAREDAKATEILKKKIDSITLEIKSRENEIKTLTAVFIAGGLKALQNVIFYNHSQELAFNWRNYNNLSEKEIEKIKKKLRLPKGVKYSVK
jgi:hypothetical protein